MDLSFIDGAVLNEIRMFVGHLFLLLGVFDLLLGMIGLIRFPDIYNRLHATTKIATLGAIFVLVSILIRDGFSPMGLKAVAVAVFLLLTSPVAGHMMGRAAFNIGVRPCNQTVVDVNVKCAPETYKDNEDFHEGAYVEMDPDGKDRDEEGRYDGGIMPGINKKEIKEGLTGKVSDDAENENGNEDSSEDKSENGNEDKNDSQNEGKNDNQNENQNENRDAA